MLNAKTGSDDYNAHRQQHALNPSVSQRRITKGNARKNISVLAEVQRVHHYGAEEDEDDDEQDGHELSGFLNVRRSMTGFLVHQHQ